MESRAERRILIVEDSEDIRDLLVTFLEGSDYVVDCVNNGKEALSYLDRTTIHPGVILLDLRMPEMDGFEFRRFQEQNAKTSHIPVILMTADADIQSKSAKVGAQAYLKKPFINLDVILNTVGQFFS